MTGRRNNSAEGNSTINNQSSGFVAEADRVVGGGRAFLDPGNGGRQHEAPLLVQDTFDDSGGLALAGVVLPGKEGIKVSLHSCQQQDGASS